MWRLKRRSAAVADRPSIADLRTEVDRLTRAPRDRDSERRLLRLRHELGFRLLEEAGDDPQHPDPAGAAPPESAGLPEVGRDELTPELLRGGILRDGCVLVRGLVPRDAALHLADEIDRAFAEREVLLERKPPAAGYYEEFELDPRRPEIDKGMRGWVHAGGGLLAADAPKVAAEMFDVFTAAGVPQLVEAYLGEPPILTFEKTTLRKADPSVSGAWHQDGHFMGPVRALNLWLSLSRCGDESPGLDVVPRRLPELVLAGVDGAVLSYQVTDERAAEVAEPKQVLRPIFEPGDALLFDELFLHQTASDPSMPKPRYAIESWFFGGSAFPDYAPFAV